MDLDINDIADLTDSDSDTQLSSLNLTLRSSLRLKPSDTEKDSSDAERQYLKHVFKQRKKERAGKSKKSRQNGSYTELVLEDFCVNRIDEPQQLVSLHIVASHNHDRSPLYTFSGKATYLGLSQDFDSLVITGVEIGDYAEFDEDDKPKKSTCNNAIWLRTAMSASRNCYYLLRTPSKKYSDVFKDFQWLATFTKHVVDYIFWATDENQKIKSSDFQKAFARKICGWHRDDVDFQTWHQACGLLRDFRRHISCAYIAEFVFDQVTSIDGGTDSALLSHPLWHEVAPQNLRDTMKYDEISLRPTFVTEGVARCFLATFPQWARRTERQEDLLQILLPAPGVHNWQAVRSHNLGLSKRTNADQAEHFEQHGGIDISVAALVLQKASYRIRREDQTPASELIGKAVVVRVGADYRFAFVRDICNEGRRLRVKWLMLPSQTICDGRTEGKHSGRAKAFYPNGNELFWSDECSCAPVLLHQIVAVHGISVNQNFTQPGHELFVHREYMSNHLAIVEPPAKVTSLCRVHDIEDIPTQEGIPTSLHLTPTSSVQAPGKVLSLFSGCGLLDLGLESSAEGLFRTIFAADCDYAALTAFKANHSERESCDFENEDVNILFEQFSQGTRPIPEFRLLTAGSPCQGFSILNGNKDTDKARKNCSMLAHTIAWVDLLRPQMVLLENVKAMDPLGQNGGVSAAGQSVSFLVSIGYQARLSVVRASDYGGPTSRERLFVIATAPGIPLPSIPKPTHGTASSLYAPVTASATTLTLPEINSTSFINPGYPDHVPFVELSTLEYGVVSKIRTTPSPTPNNLFSVRPRLKSSEEIEWYNRHTPEQKSIKASSWSRVNANKPMGTIVTSVSPRCSRSGPTLHWSQHRVCSLMELRRFHGIPDSYILLGNKSQQVHQLGNSVAWATGNVLGKAYAEA